jgi:GxxExxY protein
MKLTKQYINELSFKIIGCCIEVHKNIGPGLLESVYHRCLEKEFLLQNLSYKSEMDVDIFYKGDIIDSRLKVDFVIEDLIVLEIKAVKEMQEIFTAQTLTYMNLLEVPKSILVNFNCTNIFKEGQKTFVNSIFKSLPNF